VDLETASNQGDIKEASISLPFPKAWWGRVLYGIYITVTPILSFWATDVFKPEWKSGELSDYIILFLFPEASLVFFLLMGYSIICYLLLLISPTRYSRLFSIRFGVYTGTLLAFQYSVLSSLFFLKQRLHPCLHSALDIPCCFWASLSLGYGQMERTSCKYFLGTACRSIACQRLDRA